MPPCFIRNRYLPNRWTHTKFDSEKTQDSQAIPGARPSASAAHRASLHLSLMEMSYHHPPTSHLSPKKKPSENASKTWIVQPFESERYISYTKKWMGDFPATVVSHVTSFQGVLKRMDSFFPGAGSPRQSPICSTKVISPGLAAEKARVNGKTV